MSTPEDRKRIEDFQLEVLKRKAALLPRFKKYCDEKGLKFRAPVEEIYDYCVLEYSCLLYTSPRRWAFVALEIEAFSNPL